MGNAVQLTGAAGRPTGAWRRPALYAAGTLSMLVLTMTASLALWIALPWAIMGWTPTLVASGSMAPLVAPGDVVLVRPVATGDLGPGTVVLYQHQESERVLHRIAQVLPDGTFRTQGDANTSPDSTPVRADEIKGAAVLAVPWVGRVSLWVTRGQPLPVAAATGALLLLLGLAPRAFDPAFDPWAAAPRINPVEVLHGRSDGRSAGRRDAAGHQLLPGDLHGLILQRLSAQSGVAGHRTIELLEGLS